MRRFALAATLSIAAFCLAGCKSQQQVQQENAAKLQARWKMLDEQYKKECYDPYNTSPNDQTASKTLKQEWTKADSAAFQKEEAEKQARVASPHCQTGSVALTFLAPRCCG